jgi:predicted nucleic acid-binding protein
VGELRDHPKWFSQDYLWTKLSSIDELGLRRVVAAQPDRYRWDKLWRDEVSIADQDVFDHSRIPGPITDVYLLAVAVKNIGRLVTFDRAIPAAAVRGAERRHLAVL